MQELTKESFSEFVTDPSAIKSLDTHAFEQALSKYPYCQLLHSFYGRAASAGGVQEDKLFRAALLVPDRAILKSLITSPEQFVSTRINVQEDAEQMRATPEAKVAEELPETSVQAATAGHEPESHLASLDTLDEIREQAEDNAEMDSESSAATVEDIAEPDQQEEHTSPSPEREREDLADDHNKVSETDDSTEELREIINPEITEEAEDELDNPWDESRLETLDPSQEQAADDMQDIIGTDEETVIDNDSAEDNQETQNPEVTETEAEPATQSELEEIGGDPEKELDELDFLIQSGAAEHYSLDESAPAAEELPAVLDQVPPASRFGEHVTQYNDEKMPYSFLWWLDKTRRENTENYQPYAASFRLDTSKNITRNSVDPLSSQIIENIFHLQSPIDQLENAPRTVPFQVKRKGDYILEKFIKEEPQIKPPDSQKLDTENKARRSSEDPNDLVSETLAQIYTDQMLYHKAIDTYRKLSLKFPEKSTYFADQIIELEKKIN